jgi:8-oxo-dGTP pyrophosphatase MutT (NUDIX family)
MNRLKPPQTKEKITKTKIAYRGSILSIAEKSIDFGNGNKRTFEVINWNVITGVSALPLLDDQTVVLIEHFQAGIESSCLTLPTGGLLYGEIPEERMNAELQEEIGYYAHELTLMYRSHVLPGYLGAHAGYIYLAKQLVPSKLVGDEPFDISIHTLPLTEAISMIKSGDIIDSRTTQALLYYQTFIA